MAGWDSSKTKERLDRDISNLVSYEVDKLTDKFNHIHSEIEQLKALPARILIGIIVTFGVSLSSVAYNLIASHIETKSLIKDVEVINDTLKNGKSRSASKVMLLKYRLDELTKEVKKLKEK